jgi:hypothetical protein
MRTLKIMLYIRAKIPKKPIYFIKGFKIPLIKKPGTTPSP